MVLVGDRAVEQLALLIENGQARIDDLDDAIRPDRQTVVRGIASSRRALRPFEPDAHSVEACDQFGSGADALRFLFDRDGRSGKRRWRRRRRIAVLGGLVGVIGRIAALAIRRRLSAAGVAQCRQGRRDIEFRRGVHLDGRLRSRLQREDGERSENCRRSQNPIGHPTAIIRSGGWRDTTGGRGSGAGGQGSGASRSAPLRRMDREVCP